MVGDEQVTDAQTQEWVDEAEAGYDVEELKRRGRGRPGRGSDPMQVIAVRLTAEEIAALDALPRGNTCLAPRRSGGLWLATLREGPPQRVQARGAARGCDPGCRPRVVDLSRSRMRSGRAVS